MIRVIPISSGVVIRTCEYDARSRYNLSLRYQTVVREWRKCRNGRERPGKILRFVNSIDEQQARIEHRRLEEVFVK